MQQTLFSSGNLIKALKRQDTLPNSQKGSQSRLRGVGPNAHPNKSPRMHFRNGFTINRFPIMACLAYCVAKRTGYSENMARSLGIGTATGYAILKNVGIGNYRTSKPERTLDEQLLDKLPRKEFRKVKTLYFCGISFLVKGEEVLGLANVRGKQDSFSPEKFNNQIIRLNSLRKSGFQFLCKEINKTLTNEQTKDFGKEIYGKHFFSFWKKYRDYFRTSEFWGK
jgi:hypothetical protein